MSNIYFFSFIKSYILKIQKMSVPLAFKGLFIKYFFYLKLYKNLHQKNHLNQKLSINLKFNPLEYKDEGKLALYPLTSFVQDSFESLTFIFL